MSDTDISKSPIEALISEFVELALQQDDAFNDDTQDRYNQLQDRMVAISDELKARGMAARRSLLPLFDHPNVQVRMQAAVYGYGVDPEKARRCLQAIAADSMISPQYLHAGMHLSLLDAGIGNKLD